MKTKKIEIFGTKWTICYQDHIESEGDGFTFGHTDSVSKIITVATKDRDGNPLPEREVRLTMYHELFHAILLEGQYNGYSEDEPLVEWLAKCILSLEGKL